LQENEKTDRIRRNKVKKGRKNGKEIGKSIYIYIHTPMSSANQVGQLDHNTTNFSNAIVPVPVL
jgi:hypothetical protein